MVRSRKEEQDEVMYTEEGGAGREREDGPRPILPTLPLPCRDEVTQLIYMLRTHYRRGG